MCQVIFIATYIFLLARYETLSPAWLLFRGYFLLGRMLTSYIQASSSNLPLWAVVPMSARFPLLYRPVPRGPFKKPRPIPALSEDGELRNSLRDAVLSLLSMTHIVMFKNWVPYCSSEQEVRPSVSAMVGASVYSILPPLGSSDKRTADDQIVGSHYLRPQSWINREGLSLYPITRPPILDTTVATRGQGPTVQRKGKKALGACFLLGMLG